MSLEDKDWFETAILRTVKSQLGEDQAYLVQNQEPYFVDFLRDAPEPTGEEPEDADLDAPKVYEAVSN